MSVWKEIYAQYVYAHVEKALVLSTAYLKRDLYRRQKRRIHKKRDLQICKEWVVSEDHHTSQKRPICKVKQTYISPNIST